MKKIIHSTWYIVHSTIIILTCQMGYAQDIHFSQFNNSPIQINPGLTGGFNGNVRAYMQYRNQWQSIAPFRTFAFSADGRLKQWKESYLAGGIFVYSDKAGDLQVSTTQVLLSVAEHIKLDKHNTISAGIQGGFGQKGMAGTDRRWGAQYNGFKYDATIPGEDVTFNSFMYGDYAAGVAWSYAKNAGTLSSNNNMWVKVGAAYQHINKPKLDYYAVEGRLYSKVLFQAYGHIGLTNTPFAIRPAILFNNQGMQNELNVGLLVRYQISEASKYTGLKNATTIAVGSYFRIKDAIIPTIQLEHSNYALGLSYDINISKLSAATGSKGGIEIFLKFVTPSPFGGGAKSKSRSRFN